MTASDEVRASTRYTLMVEPAELRSSRLGWFGRWLRRHRSVDDGMLIFYVLDRETGESFMRHIEPADDPHVFEEVERDLETLSVTDFERRWR